jgi:hypothetical protein
VAWVRELLPNDLHFFEKLVPIFVDSGRHVASVTYPYGRILGFLDRSCYSFFQEATQLYSTRLNGPRSRSTTSQKMW